MEKLIKALMKHPELASEIINSLVQKYKPAMYATGSELLNIYKDLVNNDEYFETVAGFQKKIYDAYVSAGFSETQAMTLLLQRNLELTKQVRNINFSAS